jgi:hypothetical protein
LPAALEARLVADPDAGSEGYLSFLLINVEIDSILSEAKCHQSKMKKNEVEHYPS